MHGTFVELPYWWVRLDSAARCSCSALYPYLNREWQFDVICSGSLSLFFVVGLFSLDRHLAFYSITHKMQIDARVTALFLLINSILSEPKTTLRQRWWLNPIGSWKVAHDLYTGYLARARAPLLHLSIYWKVRVLRPLTNLFTTLFDSWLVRYRWVGLRLELALYLPHCV